MKTIPAKYRTICPRCRGMIGIGDPIAKLNGAWGHPDCSAQPDLSMADELPEAQHSYRAVSYALPSEADKPTQIQIKENTPNGSAAAVGLSVSLGGAGLAVLDDIDVSVPEKPKREFTPSKYQLAVFEFVEHGTGHGLIDAKAGSGKTTTEEKAITYTPADAKVIYLAFNKRIVNEAKDRMPTHCKVATTHSQGFANVRRAFGKVQVEEKKTWQLIDQLRENASYSTAEVIDENGSVIRQLVGLVKNTLSEIDDASLDALCDHYGIEANGSSAIIFDAVRRIVEQSHAMTQVIDFDDMLWFCALGMVACEQFDYLFIDEAQDLNKAQTAFILRSCKPGGRIIAVGDPAQSIYGFRGADVNAIPNLIDALSATQLPLSICYRCPKSHIRLAQSLVPEIEWREDAPEGVIETIAEASFLTRVQQGDMVICRTNAPLVSPAFELIRRGVKAIIVGRDIGKGLTGLLRKIEKRYRTASLSDTLHALNDYTMREVMKLTAADKGTQAQSLQDQCDTLIALAEGCQSIDDIERKIESVFDDEVKGIAFSSIHRAKGLEAERVFLLHPELLPHPMAKRDWEKAQERNIQYVAFTRAKAELYFVTPEEK